MYNVLDLFAGCGGFSTGFKKVGFNIVGAIEFDKNAALSYKENHKNTKLYLDDIRKLDIETVKNDLPPIDVIIGGPPCQGFSIAGKRDINDQRNSLPLEFIRYINYFKPKIFVMENVKGILSMDEGRLINFFLEEFKQAGYVVKLKLIPAVKYGIPQLRERVIIVGVREDIDIAFEYPQEESNVKTLFDAIGDIEDIGSYDETGLHNHDMDYIVDERLYSLLQEGQFLCDIRHGNEHIHSWEISLKGECSEKEIHILNSIAENRRKKQYGPKDGNPLSEEVIKELTGYTNIKEELSNLVNMEYIDLINDKYDIHDRKVNMGLRRFDRNKPVNTITTQSGANSVYAHYNKARNFTVREVARLQTFPDDFIFYGPINSQYRQVGNAVPPLLGEKIAQQVLKVLCE